VNYCYIKKLRDISERGLSIYVIISYSQEFYKYFLPNIHSLMKASCIHNKNKSVSKQLMKGWITFSKKAINLALNSQSYKKFFLLVS
jgi:hypothetical protein